jgi:o-succinylbenzoate---CoA ligase
MTRALKIVPANDTFAALIAFADVLDGKSALFISGPEVNGVKPEIAELPDTVSDDTALILETSGSTGITKENINFSRGTNSKRKSF